MIYQRLPVIPAGWYIARSEVDDGAGDALIRWYEVGAWGPHVALASDQPDAPPSQGGGTTTAPALPPTPTPPERDPL